MLEDALSDSEAAKVEKAWDDRLNPYYAGRCSFSNV